MRNVDRSQPEAFLNLTHEIENAGTHTDVEHRHRLVGHDKLRPKDQRAGEHDTLKLPAGKLMRIFLQQVTDPAHVHALEHNADTIVVLGPRNARIDQRLDQHAADGEARVQGVERILEDELSYPPECLELLAMKRCQIEAADRYAARGRGFELQE